MQQGRPRTREPKAEKAKDQAPAASAESQANEEQADPSQEAPNDQVAQAPERGPGRPSKYGAIDLSLAHRFAKAGLTDEQIAELLGISISSYYEYRNDHPEFTEAIKTGQEDPKARVKRSLYQNAIGFIHPEEKIFREAGPDGKMTTVRVMTTKQYKPDTTAQIFYLVNKCGDEFKDIRHIQASGAVNLNHKGTIPSAFMDDMNKALAKLGERPVSLPGTMVPGPAAAPARRAPAATPSPAPQAPKPPAPAPEETSADLGNEEDADPDDGIQFTQDDYKPETPAGFKMDLSDLEDES